ncbi:antigen [Sarotherodon galilaeus]
MWDFGGGGLEMTERLTGSPAIARSKAVFLHIVLSSISFLTVALNLLVIISVSHFRQLHTPTNILLLSLAVSDFLVGLLLSPAEILRSTACWFLGQLTCLMYIFVLDSDRYVPICDPFNYPIRITDRRVPLCFCFLVRDELHQTRKQNSCYGKCVVVVQYIAGVVDLILTFIVPVTVIVVLYMRVFVVAVHLPVTLTKKSELKAARTLGVLVLVFLMCFCPYYCVSLVGEEFINSSSASFVAYLFGLNSCLNPLIYAVFYPWFRKAVKLVVTLQILQPGSSETAPHTH